MQLCGREPTLTELLNDPIVHLVMRADGVTKSDILSLYDANSDDVREEEEMPAFMCSHLIESCCRSHS